MAADQHLFSISNCKAAADYSAKQFYAMKLTAGTADSVTLAAAATDPCIGILQNAPTSGHAALVQTHGVSKAVSDGTTPIAVGDLVGPNSSGKMVKKATADYNVMGIAMDASSADGTIIRVFLTPLAVFRSLAG